MAEKTKADALYAFGKSLCTLLKEEGIDARLYGLFTEEPEIVCSKDGATVAVKVAETFHVSSESGLQAAANYVKEKLSPEELKRQRLEEDLALAEDFCKTLEKYGYKTDKEVEASGDVRIWCETEPEAKNDPICINCTASNLRNIMAQVGEAGVIREMEYALVREYMDAPVADFCVQLIWKLRSAGYTAKIGTAKDSSICYVCCDGAGGTKVRGKLPGAYLQAKANGGLDGTVKHIESLLWKGNPVKKGNQDDGYVYMRFDAGKGRGTYFAKSMAKLADGDKDKLLGSLQDVYEELYEQQLDAKFISKEEYEAGLAEKRIPPQIVM